MAWKNGGGETTEIAVSPEGAGLDAFDWRVSMARVERDGPFSAFPGIDRTLAILEGEGIILDVEGQVPFGMARRFEPVTFPADAPTSSRLTGGPILDLNVMSRRGTVAHAVRAFVVEGPVEVDFAEPDTLVVCVEGEVEFACDEARDRLERYDCLVWDGAPGVLRFWPPSAAATLMMIEFNRT